MAALLSRSLFLALVIRIKADGCFERFGSNKADCLKSLGKCEWLEKDGEGKCVMPVRPKRGSKFEDGCYERFGSDKAKCIAAEGTCEWLEENGVGKCAMPAKKDGCFERFGFHKANCTATNGRCLWVERDGEGKCVMPVHPKRGSKFEDRFARHPRKVVGVLAISIISSLASTEVLKAIDQHRFLLENAVARVHGYKNVTILGVDSARRLREATSTRLRVRFEAEAANSTLVRGEAINHPQDELEKALEDSFEKAGLDFRVQSATVAVTDAEASTASSEGREVNGFSKLVVGFTAIGSVIACTCAAMLCMRWRWSARSVTAKSAGHGTGATTIYIKETDLSKIDDDLASVSTGTPSTNADFSIP